MVICLAVVAVVTAINWQLVVLICFHGNMLASSHGNMLEVVMVTCWK